MGGKIQSFTDLQAWKEGHRLVLMIYDITNNFPKQERYGLTSQMRRAAISITSNIAEGFQRHSAKEKRQFYAISAASLSEIQNQLLVSRDVRYIDNTIFKSNALQTVLVSKLLQGIIKSAQNRK
jgi:four helix bundle protein